MEDRIGCFAVSLAGHDRGRLYVIVGYQEGAYLLADGRLKTLERPKRKKGRHLRMICGERPVFPSGKPIRNEEVKRAIKLRSAKKPIK